MVADLLAVLTHLGFRLRLTPDGSRLEVSPKRDVSPPLRAIIARHRDEIMAMLSDGQPAHFHAFAEGTSRFDPDIIATEVMRRSPEYARAASQRCLDRYAHTGNERDINAALDWVRTELGARSLRAALDQFPELGDPREQRFVASHLRCMAATLLSAPKS